MIDRHEDATKSILFALVPLCTHIRSHFYVNNVFLSTRWSFVAIVINSSCDGATAEPDLALRH